MPDIKETSAEPKRRSPRCPSNMLKDAIERTGKVYDKEARHEAPIDAVAQDMGYTNSRGGAAATTLASLTYFGLLVRLSDGKLAVSKEYEDYKFSPDDKQKHKLIIGWLRKPPIYAELLDRYSTGLPSDATLKYDFIQLGFPAKNADDYVGIFKKSVEFSNYYQRELPQTPEAESDDASDNSANEDTATRNRPKKSANEDIPAPELSTEYDVIPVRLPKGRKANLVIPNPFFESDKKHLKAFIDLIYAEEERPENNEERSIFD